MDFLLFKGANIELRNSDGNYVLHTAIQTNAEKGVVERIAKVMNNTCGVSVTNKLDQIPLHLAKNPLLAEILIFYGGNYDRQDKDGKTLVHTRVEDMQMISYLLTKGLDTGVRDFRGRLALHYAVMCRVPNLEVIKKLIGSQEEVNAQDAAGDSPLHLLCDNKYKQFMVLGADKNECETQTIDPKSANDLILLHLLSLGAKINLQNTNGETALHRSLKNKSTVKSNILAESGADPLIEDVNGITPKQINKGWFGRLDKQGTFIKQEECIVGDRKPLDKGDSSLPDWVLHNDSPDSGFTESLAGSPTLQSKPPPSVHLVRTKTTLNGKIS